LAAMVRCGVVSVLWFALLLAVLVSVHELGHLLAARIFGVHVLRISFGFGPVLFRRYWKGTEWALSALPFGGYVRLLGEDRRERILASEAKHAFGARPAWQRLVIIAAGPLANLTFPFFLFLRLSAHQGNEPAAVIGTIYGGQPAAEADLRGGDRVIAIDDTPIEGWKSLHERIRAAPGHELRMTVERPGVDRPITKYVRPREHLRPDVFGLPERVGLLGIAPERRLPLVGVLPNSPASLGGMRTFDIVLSVQGRAIHTPAELEPLVRPRSGALLIVTYLRFETTGIGFAPVRRLYSATAQVVPRALERPGHAPLYDSGLRPADLFVYEVESGTPAAKLGLQPGDQIVSFDGTTPDSFELMLDQLEEQPMREHRLVWRPADSTSEKSGLFYLASARRRDEFQMEQAYYTFGAEGARAIKPVHSRLLAEPAPDTVMRALQEEFAVIGTLFRAVGLAVSGQLSASSIGGPILLYQVAGMAAHKGRDQFLAVAALISLNLGLLNLLPLPLLDGGQALLTALESVRRRPLPARLVGRASVFGVALLFALILFASYNDLQRLFTNLLRT
jgi:regulator of sigma E protease